MEQAEWWRDAAGNTLTYCCLDTTSRGFARFGLLYLRDGRWGRDRVIKRSWVRDSLEAAPTAPGLYGYQWWLDDVPGVPADMFSAVGHDGQYIYVIPSLDLVVVRNGTYVKDPGEPIAERLFGKYPSTGGAGRARPPASGRREVHRPSRVITDPDLEREPRRPRNGVARRAARLPYGRPATPLWRSGPAAWMSGARRSGREVVVPLSA